MALESITAVISEKTDKETGVVTPSRSVTVEIDVGKDQDINWYISAYGDKVVHSKIYQKVTIDAQARMRSLMTAGKTEAEIVEAMSTWKPGVTSPKKSPVEKAFAATENMSDEQLADFLTKLKAKAAGKK